MDNEIKQFKVQADDPYFTANKWNESLDYSINFEKMIKSILGSKFKGIYKVSNEYNKYDYVWYNDSFYQILDSVNPTTNVSNSNELSNVYKYKDGLLGLNKRKEIVYYTNIENILINNVYDTFCYDYISDKCYAVKDNRLYSINLETKEVQLLNIVFGNNIVIEKVLCDEGNIYIKSNNSIYKSIFSNSTSTLFEEIYKGQDIVDFDISNDLVFIVDLYNGINIISKNKKSNFSTKVNTTFKITTDVKISAIDNNTFAIYDGTTNIFTFFNSGSGIYTLESTILNYEGFNQGINSITKDKYSLLATSLNNSLVSISSNKYSIEKVELNHIISRNTNIELNNSDVICHLAYKDGYFTHKGKTFLKESYCNYQIINYLPTIENNKQITFDFTSISYFKTLMFKINTSAKGQNIGKLNYNGLSYNIVLPNFDREEITVFLEYSKDSKMIATFITNDKIEEQVLTGTSTNSDTILQIKSEYTVVLKEVLLLAYNISASYKDYLSNNTILPSKDIIKTPIPFSNVHIDEDGNLPLKLKNTSLLKDTNGLSVNISDNPDTNNGEIALSTAGAKSMYNKFISDLEESLKDFSGNDHTHSFDEIRNVPVASQSVQGIISLAQSISDSTNTAVTPKAVKEFGATLADKNHTHNFNDLNSIPTASNSTRGIVQLHNSIDWESNKAVTPNAVNSKLGEYLHKKSGGHIEGTLTVNSFVLNGWKIEVVDA